MQVRADVNNMSKEKETYKNESSCEFANRIEKMYNGEFITEFTDNESELISMLRTDSDSLGNFISRLQKVKFSEFKIGVIYGTLKWTIIFYKALKSINVESKRLGRNLTSEEIDEILKNEEFNMK